jgi:lipopolysaccharide biosynthesis glycosyltransferase
MRLAIPSQIKTNLHDISRVILVVVNPVMPITAELNFTHILNFDWVELHDRVFESASCIKFAVQYTNEAVENIVFSNKWEAIHTSQYPNGSHLCVRNQTSKLFENSLEGRLACLDEVDSRILEVYRQDDEDYGLKNLIYYTVFFDNGYVELLNKSIMSVLENSSASFDILLITDRATKKKIEKQPFTKYIKPKYLLVAAPADGIKASQNKLRVFDYDRIKRYGKILFLDCDVICLKDVDKIFKQDIHTDRLYTARNLDLTMRHHSTFPHGFDFLGEEHIAAMSELGQMPFNAGQFLFRASRKMRQHFNNVNWFMSNWSGEYFFEQSFMNYYFCKAGLTDDTVLQKYVSVICTTDEVEGQTTENTCLVHFIAPPLNAKAKLEYISEFSDRFS